METLSKYALETTLIASAVWLVLLILVLHFKVGGSHLRVFVTKRKIFPIIISAASMLSVILVLWEIQSLKADFNNKTIEVVVYKPGIKHQLQIDTIQVKNINKNSLVVRGLIVDEKGKPISNAKISLYSVLNLTSTDSSGFFSFAINVTDLRDSVVPVIVTKDGYLPQFTLNSYFKDGYIAELPLQRRIQPELNGSFSTHIVHNGALDTKANKPADCRTISIEGIPGYSSRNRYFNLEKGNSFFLNSRNFGVYQSGRPDTYSWDSIKHCGVSFVFYFPRERFQEVMPDSALANITKNQIILNTEVGILYGRYSLLFDFSVNNTVENIPSNDIGTWDLLYMGPKQIILDGSKTLQIRDSDNLYRYKITKIEYDRRDSSTLYFVNELQVPQNSQTDVGQVLMKHGLKETILFLGNSTQNIESVYPYYNLRKVNP